MLFRFRKMPLTEPVNASTGMMYFSVALMSYISLARLIRSGWNSGYALPSLLAHL